MALSLKSPSILQILNGLVGDKLALKKNSWSIEMSFRVGGKDTPIQDLNRKLRGKRVIVFVHGLMADERIWKEMASHIKRDFQCLFVRYNTGLHISSNGRKLSELLEELHRMYSPKEIALAGHSMGGLVIRSACYYADKDMKTWHRTVKKIFLLAVPNDGAALEKLSHATSFVLRKIASFQLGLIGNVLEQRSDGIKDLRHGAMLEEDWNSSKRTPVPPLARVTYHILVGSLFKDDQSFMAKYFGDGLVTHGSAISQTLMHAAEVKIFGGTGHNSLLRTKAVCQHVTESLRKP